MNLRITIISRALYRWVTPGYMAGKEGIEPSHLWFKATCLTFWLLPYFFGTSRETWTLNVFRRWFLRPVPIPVRLPRHLMAPWIGLEPITYGLEDRYSIQLSYQGKFWWWLRDSNPWMYAWKAYELNHFSKPPDRIWNCQRSITYLILNK